MKKRAMIICVVTLALLITLTGCGAGGYTDGTYEGTGQGVHGEVKTEVVVKDGKIAEVNVVSHSETEGIGTTAVDQIPAKIVEAQSPEVDVITGATVTSQAIIDGVTSALSQAE